MRGALLLPVLMVLASASTAAAQDFTPVTDPEKTDVLVLRNGDRITGEFRELARGIVTFKTDAASYIYVKWPRVVVASTDKVFDIELRSGTHYVGSIAPGEATNRVRILAARDTVEVPIESVVSMVRIRKTFLERLDGSLDAGFNFTQQNSKLDVNVSTTVHYDIANNRFQIGFDGTFSRQDSVAATKRRDVTATYSHALGSRWFWAASGSVHQNSQLALERSWTAGTGPGRYFVLSNKVVFGSWIGIYARNERYTGDDARGTIPLSVVTDLEWFSWSGRSTDLSTRLVVSPILNNAGRWQISFTTSVKRELLSLLYLSFSINEYYDSSPPTNANKNDFSLKTSIGWTF